MRFLCSLGVSLLALSAIAACGGDDSSGEGGAGPGGAGGAGGGSGGSGGAVVVETLRVSGTVVDFKGGAAITGSATISTDGLSPPPTVQVMGADFEISGVPPFSVFHLLSGAPPDYRSTYNVATEVMDMDLTGVTAEVVSEAYLTALATGFNTANAPGTGLILARAVDEAGSPLAGVPGSVFTVNGGPPPKLPRFLDANKDPAPGLNETSASGYVVFFDVPAGVATIGSADGSGFTVVAATAPTAATAVTLARMTVTPGGPVLPVNVSFSNDIVPIFSGRGCKVCHSGSSPGADLGNLALNGSDNSIFKELTEEISQNFATTRVDLMDPAKSLILTMPSYEPEPDPHPNVTFASPADPDYLKLLAWITEGAKQN